MKDGRSKPGGLDSLSELRLELYERALERMFERKRPLWEAEMARILASAARQPARREWIAISSLGSLRKTAGGRFERLKELWVGAGFPLRRHRGDRSQGSETVQSGWLELQAWLETRGFEARICAVGTEALFELRSRR